MRLDSLSISLESDAVTLRHADYAHPPHTACIWVMASTEDLTRGIVDQLATFDNSSLSELYLDNKEHLNEFRRLADQELGTIEKAQTRLREKTTKLDALIEKEKLVQRYLYEACLEREARCAQALRQAVELPDASATLPRLSAARQALVDVHTELRNTQLKSITYEQYSGLTPDEAREARWVRIFETLPINPARADAQPSDFWSALEELCLPLDEPAT